MRGNRLAIFIHSYQILADSTLCCSNIDFAFLGRPIIILKKVFHKFST